MVKVMKPGKVVVVLRGKYAGRKAVIVKLFEEGTSARKFGHALIVGIDKHPKKITRKMDEKKIEKRTKITPFIKLMNLSHLMPTRYQADFDLKKVTLENKEKKETEEVTLDETVLVDPGKRKMASGAVKKVFEAGYMKQDDRKSSKATEGVKYFYQKLHF